MPKIRILHVVSSLSLSNGIMGVIMNYYRRIDRNKVQFDFIYVFNDDLTYENEIRNLGGKTYNIKPPKIKNILLYQHYLKSFFNSHNFNYKIVHIHEIVLISLFSRPLRKFGTKVIISHSHSVAYSFHPLKAIRNRILSLPIKSMVDRYCACSLAAGEYWYGKKLIQNDKVKIINNAINVEKFLFNKTIREKIREDLKLTNSFVVGHVGRFSREKNQRYIIEIFNELLKDRPDSKLLLVGDGPKFYDIQKQAESLGIIDKIVFLGKQQNVHELYQAMDIFVFPSLNEGLGTAAIEAQASGLPSLISDTLTQELDIDNVQFLSIKAPPSIWAKYIIKTKLIRKDNEAKIREKGFSIDRETDKLLHYYERLFI